ncbi:MAG: hypothetical protein KZY74_00905 [Paenibacillaceae bacterium]|uniref:Uncharacterized protein n=1 Tax=Paenibacillus mellifer TaxID=2937794 RepID=A0A9X2BMR7_9BACL|nr:hypothetical protein [Paenibacillus mellifer]MBW4837926.1 hypothetical protein [Paenibacillaceae bacterium]MCK8486004.1 hypothetical protein [Paenibacillus mellifer]
METTICPWCQTEIVWDEELGPEEECPHCHNELKGYRTINISLGRDEEFEDEENDHPFQDRKHRHDEDDEDGESYWEEEGEAHLGAVRRIEAFTASGGDWLKYETGVEKLLDGQDEVPECPHCREYMVYAGKQKLISPDGGFEAAIPAGSDRPLLPEEAELNVYVCSACFHVSRFLNEPARIAMIRTISGEEDNE